jgi:alanine racemase
MNKLHSLRCWAEIDPCALSFNLRRLRTLRPGSPPPIPVIKANAYGHGAAAIAQHLWREGVRTVAVANMAEADGVSRAAAGMNVLLLSPMLPDEILELTRHPRWMATLSSLTELRQFERVAARAHRPISVHLELDTGMGRTGAFPREVLDLLRRMGASRWVQPKGLFSHLAAADSNRDESIRQWLRFKAFIGMVQRAHAKIPPLHFENSAGSVVLATRKEKDGLPSCGIRSGLALYGVPEPRSTWIHRFGSHPLRPVLAWKTRIGLIRDMPSKATLSYGGTFRTRRPTRIAILCAGYADGIQRKLSNRGQVLIRGQRCNILGRVTMDMIIVDVTRVPQARWGDTAVLIGKSESDEITASEFAEWAETIPYEVFCGISSRVPRALRPL